MATQQFPPQAYTRETLEEAFNWLKDQDEYVQNMLKSADELVALFLRQKRRGEDAPVNAKTFKENLKNLAVGLKQFEEDQSEGDFFRTPDNKALSQDPGKAEQNTLVRNDARVDMSVQAQKPNAPETPPQVIPKPTSPKPSTHSFFAPANSHGLGNSSLFEQLDKTSRGMISEIKQRLNMQSEGDIIRMLIALGYAQLEDKLPHDPAQMTSRPK